jgi:nitroimidazol reductase NimA-like FMN-containing flavoprotein (pyridoxamine 5'-phosphate oxidase superfamily)
MEPTEPQETQDGVRELSHDECLRALHESSLGRLAVSNGALPTILPVNYAMEGANVVFRTRQGSLLDRTCRNTVVAFEIDAFDAPSHTGWSVVVIGIANVLYAGDWLRAVELGLTSAGAADGSVFVKIVPGTITGRTVGTHTTIPQHSSIA